MDISQLLFKKYMHRGNHRYSNGEYFEAYLSYRQATCYNKLSRLGYLLIAKSLYEMCQFKQCYENIQICKKITLATGKGTISNLQMLRSILLRKFMRPKFVLPTIIEGVPLGNIEEDEYDEFAIAEAIFDRSIDFELSVNGDLGDDKGWMEENLPPDAEFTADCTDDLLEEHLWGLDDDDWDSDETFTGDTVIDSSSCIDLNVDELDDEVGKTDEPVAKAEAEE